MATKIILTRKELQKINNILNNDLFDCVERFTIENSGVIGGLGSITTLSFDYHIDGNDGVYSIELSGVENW